MTSLKIRQLAAHIALALALVLLGVSAGPARGAAIVTTNSGADQVIIYPTPNASLPAPHAVAVAGLPSGAHPHGVSCFLPDTCLISDVGNARVLVVDVTTASVVETIDTSPPIGYSGDGTIAVNPAKTFALAADPAFFFGLGQLTVIAAPFNSGSAITKVSLSGSVTPGGTQSIVFDPAGRAFVCTGGAIAVLDPPYTVLKFTLPLPTNTCGELAMAPGGSALLAPAGKFVNIFTAPITDSSTATALSVPEAGGLAGAAVTADGTRALVVDTTGTSLWAVSAPFTGASAVERIVLPAGFPALRQIAISPDDQLAILTGGGGNNNPHLAFVQPPFTAAGATVFHVAIPAGIGLGGVNFLGPAGPPIPPPPSCDPISVSTSARGTAAPNAPAASAGTVPLVAALLPASRSVRVNCPATAFVTVINAGADTATGVAVAPTTQVPGTFVYQTTDPATNALTNFPNQPADIQPGQAQSFVIALTPTAPFPPTDVALSFSGTNTEPVTPVIGLNTLLLSASDLPVPDIVALAATTGNNGIVDIAGAPGAGAFAVATVNVGLGASITVTADTGSAGLPVTLTVCRTDPGTGACLAPPAASVNAFIDGGATPTFAIFAVSQVPIGFDPGPTRVFARFKDVTGITRGSTSVAIRTTN